MKKFVSVFLIFVLVFSLSSMLCSLCACTDDSTLTNSGEEDSLISESTAERLATNALYSRVKLMYSSEYDVSQTRYSIGSISPDGFGGYTVNGIYYLYDKYVNYETSRNFSVEVSSNGNVTVNEY